MAFDDNKREFSIGELENANTDRTVNPAVIVRGLMGKNSGNWVYLSADSNGNLVVNATVATAPLSADSSRISAVQGDANIFHTSAVQGDAGLFHVSGFSPDAGLFRVSSIGGSGGISANQSLSALGLEGTAHLGSVSAVNQDANFMHVSGFSPDATLFRVSSIIDSGSISARSGDANQLHVSAVQGDAGLFHVSAVGTIAVSAHEVKQSDATSLRTSAIVDSGSVSAKSPDANNLHVSSVQGDAGLQHTSAWLGVDTTGSLTTFQTLSVSASQSIKGSAGVLYGYYLYNTDTKPNYVKFFNVSAAASIGTDTPLLTVCLPASAAANMEFPHGIKGFTNGINITATSGRPLDNTALPAASSVGAVLFYN